MKDRDCIKRIRYLAKQLKAIEGMECTCSSFAMQYNNGCYCIKGEKKREIEKEFWDLIEEIKND